MCKKSPIARGVFFRSFGLVILASFFSAAPSSWAALTAADAFTSWLDEGGGGSVAHQVPGDTPDAVIEKMKKPIAEYIRARDLVQKYKDFKEDDEDDLVDRENKQLDLRRKKQGTYSTKNYSIGPVSFDLRKYTNRAEHSKFKRDADKNALYVNATKDRLDRDQKALADAETALVDARRKMVRAVSGVRDAGDVHHLMEAFGRGEFQSPEGTNIENQIRARLNLPARGGILGVVPAAAPAGGGLALPMGPPVAPVAAAGGGGGPAPVAAAPGPAKVFPPYADHSLFPHPVGGAAGPVSFSGKTDDQVRKMIHDAARNGLDGEGIDFDDPCSSDVVNMIEEIAQGAKPVVTHVGTEHFDDIKVQEAAQKAKDACDNSDPNAAKFVHAVLRAHFARIFKERNLLTSAQLKPFVDVATGIADHGICTVCVPPPAGAPLAGVAPVLAPITAALGAVPGGPVGAPGAHLFAGAAPVGVPAAANALEKANVKQDAGAWLIQGFNVGVTPIAAGAFPFAPVLTPTAALNQKIAELDTAGADLQGLKNKYDIVRSEMNANPLAYESNALDLKVKYDTSMVKVGNVIGQYGRILIDKNPKPAWFNAYMTAAGAAVPLLDRAVQLFQQDLFTAANSGDVEPTQATLATTFPRLAQPEILDLTVKLWKTIHSGRDFMLALAQDSRDDDLKARVFRLETYRDFLARKVGIPAAQVPLQPNIGETPQAFADRFNEFQKHRSDLVRVHESMELLYRSLAAKLPVADSLKVEAQNRIAPTGLLKNQERLRERADFLTAQVNLDFFAMTKPAGPGPITTVAEYDDRDRAVDPLVRDNETKIRAQLAILNDRTKSQAEHQNAIKEATKLIAKFRSLRDEFGFQWPGYPQHAREMLYWANTETQYVTDLDIAITNQINNAAPGQKVHFLAVAP